MQEKYMFLILLAVRFLSVIIVQTFYVPDEYWQSLEVAHNVVFQYGYLTWEWRESAIRSFLYPSLFVILYKLLHIMNLDYRHALILSPRFLQAFFTAIGDMYTVKLSKKLYGKSAGWWTFLSIFSSWFLFYCGSRTLINTMETALTAVTLYYFPWKSVENKKRSPRYFIGLAALTCLFRPTSGILWLPLALILIKTTQHLLKLLSTFSVVGFLMLLLSAVIDSLFYKRWVFTLYNFAHFNVISGLSNFYGSHPWHWYLTQGFPAIMATHLVPFVFALRGRRWRSLPVLLIFWQLFVYSCISHKEFRFIMPVLPLAFCMVGKYLSTIESTDKLWKAKHLYVVMAIANAMVALFFGQIWGQGPLEAIEQVANEVEGKPIETQILFLMPCHSLPLYSHLHVNVTARFLTCEPNLQQLDQYMDESDRFYQNQTLYIENELLKLPMPDIIVIFNSLEENFTSFFNLNYYAHCRTAHYFGMPDSRKSEKILIYCKKQNFTNI